MSKIRIGLLAVLGLAALLPSARATSLVFDLGGCSGCPPGPYGTITLTQTAPNVVDVVEQLAPNVFADTGAGTALGYTLDATATTSISGLSSGFAAAGSQTFAGFGTFPSTINCTGCGNGTSPPQYNYLSFTLTGTNGADPLDLADFIPNSMGFYFASDIGVTSNGTVVWTGNVGATSGGGGGGGSVPEPRTYLLLGAGLIGLSLLKRKLRIA